jgi:serine/threonine protein kinase
MLWMAEHKLQDGKYIIKEILGAGAYGITYKALHTCLGTYVAIKTVNKTVSSLGELEYQKYVLGFKKEGQILEKLSKKFHPNIVRVRDFFEENGFPCLVMDFVEGETLMQLVQRKKILSPEEIVSYIHQISEALATVHDVGLVHRDVQPCNILIQADGKAILIDFGITKSQVSLTQNSLTASGTLSFAPEEQFTGNREPTVDIFALAGSLYYGITGRPPESYFDRRAIETQLTPPKQLVPQLSDQLNSVIIQGMALDPKARPQSIQEWIFLLSNVIVSDSIGVTGSRINDLTSSSQKSIPNLSFSESIFEVPVEENVVVSKEISIPQEFLIQDINSSSRNLVELNTSNPENQSKFEWGWLFNAVFFFVILPVTIFMAPRTDNASIVVVGTLIVVAKLWKGTQPSK